MNILKYFYAPASRWHIMLLAVILMAVICMAGCTTDNAKETGQLSGQNGALGPASAPYAVLNLNTGAVTLMAALPDLSNAAYTSTSMIFRRVSGSGSDFFLGIYEVTQGQWMTLAGTQPWTSVPTTVVDVAAASVRPAFNMSYEDVQTALTSFNNTYGNKLKIPTTAQWQFASTGGSSGSWSWGDSTDHATIAGNAVVWETHGSSLGPQTAGSKAANGYGLFDMHGNVWEWTSPGINVCGGSWSDSYRLSKLNSSLKSLTASTKHALVGVRLLLIQ